MKMLLNGTLLLLLHFVVKSEAQYSTCKNTCEIEYEDDNKWGIENNEWCILPGSCFDTCWSSALGYPCCKGCDITSTDSDGDWGVENNEWCGILSSCKESNASCWSLAYGYDCCKGCEVSFIDNDGKWGFENEEWCGIKEDCATEKTTTTTKKTTTTPKKTTTTTTKAPVPTQKCKCQYEACGPGICCGAGLSCIEKNGYAQCEPDPNAELRPATDCEIAPHFGRWCDGCLVTDTQTDGSLWGWENKSPCEIKPYECHEFLNADWTDAEHHWPIGTDKGTTTRYWDCCKPSCAWPGKFEYKTNIKLCAADGSALLDNNLISGCEGGPTYTCEDQTPWAVDDVTAYGYAAANIPGLTEADWCCTCYALTFTSFPIKGKQMIVQITNTGGDLGEGHFDLQIPGGGFGLFNGCSPRYPDIPDEDWGDRNGGVTSREGCYKLPVSMQEGCLFKFDWFRGADNPDVTYVKVDCPKELLEVSGCTRMNP
jgi:hypothetical protein